ncbi:MAG: hypothetical protein HQK89_08235 [Nitrospirae bacterium]|nr:hypothetical protein [Nitrospirota bacterium]
MKKAFNHEKHEKHEKRIVFVLSFVFFVVEKDLFVLYSVIIAKCKRL